MPSAATGRSPSKTQPGTAPTRSPILLTTGGCSSVCERTMTSDRRLSRHAPKWLIALLLGAFGCSAGGDPLPPPWAGKLGDHMPASTAANVFWVRVGVNGTTGPLAIVDTGAPVALLYAPAFN